MPGEQVGALPPPDEIGEEIKVIRFNLTKFANRLMKLEEGLAAAALLGIFVIILVSVLCRYVLLVSIPWSEELTKYLMMWMVYFGTGAVSWRGEHLQADLFGPSLPKALRKARDVFFQVILMVLLGYLAVETIGFVNRIRPFNQVSTVLRIPQWFMIATFAVGLLLMTIMHFCRIYIMLRHPDGQGTEGKGGSAA